MSTTKSRIWELNRSKFASFHHIRHFTECNWEVKHGDMKVVKKIDCTDHKK